MVNNNEIQPCEMCGKTAPPNEDDKYDDIYFPTRPGSRAVKLGYAQERLCGRCACAQFIGSYWNGTPDRLRTPVEEYRLFNRTVYVKRDDLWNNGKYGGGNAKMRGIEVHLRQMISGGIKHVAVLDSRTSRIGWGVAGLCRDLGLRCTVYYGTRQSERGAVPYFQQKAKEAGAELIEVPASRIYPMYYNARIECQKRDVYLLPMGGQLTESLLSVAGEARSLPLELTTGTIICVVATGTMFAGLLVGIKGTCRVVGVYIGMTGKELKEGKSKSDPERIIRRRITSLLPSGFEAIPFDIVLGDREYYAEDNYPCSFPCDKWYDRKAYRWMCEHIDELNDPICFWNIG